MVDRKAFEKAVTELTDSGAFSVSALASSLNVSRAWLYDHFPEVRGFSQRTRTEDDVIAELEVMRSERPFDRFTVAEVAERLGITRQTFSRKFKHLYGYLDPETNVFEPSTTEEKLLSLVRELEDKVKDLEESRELALREKEDQIFSTLMKYDADEFNLIKTSSSIKRLQDQVEDQSRLAREKAKEVNELQIEVTKLRTQQNRGGCEVVGHLEPDYSAFSAITEPTVRDAHKVFLEAERRNFKLAVEIVGEERPDFVVLFQPFFACNESSIPALPVFGKVLIVESNAFRAEIREELLKQLSHSNIMAIYAKTSLAKTKLWARGEKLVFNEDFVSKVHEGIQVPVIEDGFSAVLGFNPEISVR